MRVWRRLSTPFGEIVHPGAPIGIAEIEADFAGKSQVFTVSLLRVGTAFQHQVWQRLGDGGHEHFRGTRERRVMKSLPRLSTAIGEILHPGAPIGLAEIEADFAGKLRAFTVSPPPVGTAFQHQVWQLLGDGVTSIFGAPEREDA